MRRHLTILLPVLIVIGAVIALSAIGNVELDRPLESEAAPRRSSYNAGPTGTRALYQLLEESGQRVARWREGYESLSERAGTDALIVVGPFDAESTPSPEELQALRHWVADGGQLLIISRSPREQFGDPRIRSISLAVEQDWDLPPDELVDPAADSLIRQPTALVRGVSGLAPSRLAARLKFEPQPPPPGIPAQPSPSPSPRTSESGDAINVEEDADVLAAPVIHLGDSEGAVLSDFDYGDGRVIFLSDPFIVANNGIARGANLALALNLAQTIGGKDRTIYFDEAHHGFRERRNPLLTYFRGTPILWAIGQGLLIGLIMAYTYSRRFARPLPLQMPDRHSPLEFVGSMASLQQVARARDLALENIYHRYRAQLARALGISARADAREVAGALTRRRLPLDAREVIETIEKCERALAGAAISDEQLVTLVRRMRLAMAALRTGTARGLKA